MNWLQAALAFALVMLVLATIVTIILEGCYRIFQVRESGFRLMMERIFDDVLKPRAAHMLSGTTLADARQHFLDAVTHNQGYEGKTNRLRAAFAQSADLKDMTMMQFANRLADTDVGRAIARGGEAHVENFINDLSQKFERFGDAASQRFRGQAQFWCVCASIVLAFVANVDAVRLFQDLLSNEELSSGIVAQYGGLVADGAERPSSVEETFRNVDALGLSEDEAKRFKANIASSQAKLVELRAAGLPITIDAWPFCFGKAGATGRGALSDEKNDPKAVPADPKCDKAASLNLTLADLGEWGGIGKRILTVDGLNWFMSVVLAGLLIGLGAPFWFDLARGLTRSAQLFRALGVEDKTDKPAPPPVVDASAAPPPRTPVEAFKVAIAASRPIRRRALLDVAGKLAKRT